MHAKSNQVPFFTYNSMYTAVVNNLKVIHHLSQSSNFFTSNFDLKDYRKNSYPIKTIYYNLIKKNCPQYELPKDTNQYTITYVHGK